MIFTVVVQAWGYGAGICTRAQGGEQAAGGRQWGWGPGFGSCCSSWLQLRLYVTWDTTSKTGTDLPVTLLEQLEITPHPVLLVREISLKMVSEFQM